MRYCSLSLEIVSTDKSLGDNEGTAKTRAIASWEMRMRCSEHRGSQLQGVEGAICTGSSQSVHSEL